MALTNEIAGEIAAVSCNLIAKQLLTSAEDGWQGLTSNGRNCKLDYSPADGMPEGCPLTIKPSAREVANFAICLNCDNSRVDYRTTTAS